MNNKQFNETFSMSTFLSGVHKAHPPPSTSSLSISFFSSIDRCYSEEGEYEVYD